MHFHYPIVSTFYVKLNFFLWLYSMHGLWHLRSLTRYRTRAHGSGSTKSQLLDCQGIPPLLYILGNFRLKSKDKRQKLYEQHCQMSKLVSV